MEPTEQNRRAWEDAHTRPPARTRGGGLPAQVRASLGELQEKRVLHVGCGSGEATVELAELGATVTGVDPAGESLDEARLRAPAILWVQGEPDALPPELRRGRFDLVYGTNGYGDLAGWTAGLSAALAAGGDLLLYDEHPVATCVDGLLHWRESYFEGRWRLGQIVTALARTGFAIRAVEEYPARPGDARRLDARIPGEFLLHAVRQD